MINIDLVISRQEQKRLVDNRKNTHTITNPYPRIPMTKTQYDGVSFLVGNVASSPADSDRSLSDDWLVLQEMSSNWGCTKPHGSDRWQWVKSMVETQGKCANLRIQKLVCPFKIQSPHPSIDQLQSLQELDLSFTSGLTYLPEEIGNLGNLIKLHLNHSDITRLPPSIGRLQSLQELDPSFTSGLTDLPEEIGNFGNLIKLYLNHSDITRLPPSISLSFTSGLADLRFRERLTLEIWSN